MIGAYKAKQHKGKGIEVKREVQGWLLSSPYIIYTIIFFLIPLFYSIYLVFQDWNLISPAPVFVGLKNFQEAFTSPRIWQAFWVSYKFMIFFIPLVMIASIGLALIVHHLPKFKAIFAVCFFLPYLASGVVSSLVVRGLLSYTGPFNTFLRTVFGSSPNWLGDSNLAMGVIVTMVVWKMAGYYALIFLSGMQGIPAEIYEAAAIDGSGPWKTFWRITLPMLYPAFYTVLILAVGISLSIFTEPYTLTHGGPQMATQTWQLEIYYQAFDQFRSGYGATVALINAAVTLITILVIRRVVEAWGRQNGWR